MFVPQLNATRAKEIRQKIADLRQPGTLDVGQGRAMHRGSGPACPISEAVFEMRPIAGRTPVAAPVPRKTRRRHEFCDDNRVACPASCESGIQMIEVDRRCKLGE
jgi:hypothetical protein